jgi:uncharacterized protein YpmS
MNLKSLFNNKIFVYSLFTIIILLALNFIIPLIISLRNESEKETKSTTQLISSRNESEKKTESTTQLIQMGPNNFFGFN